MLAGCRIGPLTGGAGTELRPVQTNIEAAARRVKDVADNPVAALAATVGEVVAAHGLGLTREAACQIGSKVDHDTAQSQSPWRTGWAKALAWGCQRHGSAAVAMAATTSAVMPVEVGARRSNMVGLRDGRGRASLIPSKPSQKPGARSISAGPGPLPMGSKEGIPPTRFARSNSGKTRPRGRDCC